MDNPEHSGETLEWLRSAGAELVLDDFCVGYSSIIYLGRLPFESVRIDRALLDGNNGSDATASGMLRAVTAMTHELGRKVIVQGVETDEDVGYLRSIECEYGQGFYYGDPISERDVLQLLKLVRKSERRIQPRGLFRAAVRKKAPDEAPQTADAIADAAVGAPQEREAVPAMAAALAGATGAQPPPMPPQGRTQDPVTEPLRRPALAKAHVRPRGPMPAAASPPPPNLGSAPQFASGTGPAPQPAFDAPPPFVAPFAPQTGAPSQAPVPPPQPMPVMTAPQGQDAYPSHRRSIVLRMKSGSRLCPG